MQRSIFTYGLLAFVVSLASAVSAQDRHVRIINNTGYDLYHFYSTNSGSTRWGHDVLGSQILSNGSYMTLNFDNANGYCEFDFRAEFEDGSTLQRANVNVCEISDYSYEP